MKPMKLRTEELVLRTVTDADVDEIARMWTLGQGNLSAEQARGVLEYMTRNHARNESGQLYHLCLAVCKADAPRKVLGWCGLDGKEHPERPEIFVLLHESVRNRGYGTQCVKALLYYAFDVIGTSRVHGGCDRKNIASARMMEKGGMIHYRDEENGDPLYIAYRASNDQNKNRGGQLYE